MFSEVLKMNMNVKRLINNSISEFKDACTFAECERRYFEIKGMIACAHIGFDDLSSDELKDLNFALHDAFDEANARLRRDGEELIDD